MKALRRVVDKHMEQNANTAEHVGFIHAPFEAGPGCEFGTDCAAIRPLVLVGTKGLGLGLRFAAAAKRLEDLA